jgi:SulP family sulfate permease
MGANDASASMIDRFALHDKEHASLSAPASH